MGKVTTELSVSLDGFVAGPNDGPGKPLGEGGEALFRWYSGGDTALPLPGTDMVFQVSRASADFLSEEWGQLGAMVVGRCTFDITGGWHGHPPGGGPCFVVTHTVPPEWVTPGSPFIFVTAGVASAVRQAKEAAGEKTVSIGSASLVQQCLNAGLLDEVQLDLVPILLGGGVRLFDQLSLGQTDLVQTRLLAAPGVTHIRYRIAT